MLRFFNRHLAVLSVNSKRQLSHCLELTLPFASSGFFKGKSHYILLKPTTVLNFKMET